MAQKFLHYLKLHDDYRTKNFDYQENRRAPLAALNWHVLAETYFVGLGPIGYFCKPLPKAQPLAKSKAIEENVTFNVAAFNVSRYLNEDKPSLSCVSQLVRDFQKLSRRVCSYDHARQQYSPERTIYHEDTLLICYPGKVGKKGWENSYDHNDSHVKSQFFAMLWQQGFLTEQQLYDNNIMLGLHHRQIYEEKARLEKLGF